MAPKIAIVFYSMYGHIHKLAEAEAKGIRAAGGTVDLYQYAAPLTHSLASTHSHTGSPRHCPKRS